MNNTLTWILESSLMPEVHARLTVAAKAAGHDVLTFNDDWWDRGLPLRDPAVVFHGSLGNADRVGRADVWQPGAFCNTPAFACSAWYGSAHEYLLHERWQVLPASELVDQRDAVFASLGLGDRAFVRPDSPLKPFSGRVVERTTLSLAALDHGFYYDDETIPVVVAPIREVGREWRYVVSGGAIVSGSAYAADGRTALPDTPSGAPWRFAEQVAAAIAAPDPIFVLDVCEADGDLRLLELNPFSGADLYACAVEPIVDVVAQVCR